MSEPIVITRDKVHRGWSDLEPKIAIAGVIGFLCIIALIVAKQFGVVLPPEVASAAAVMFALLAGYVTPSAGTVVTRRTEGAQVTESHSAPTVTTVTASTPVQSPRDLTSDQVAAVQARRVSFTEVVAPDAPAQLDQPTTVLPTPDEVPTVSFGSWNPNS